MAKANGTLWEVSITTKPGQPDAEHVRVSSEVGLLEHTIQSRFGTGVPRFQTERGYLIEANLAVDDVTTLANELLADVVIEKASVAAVGKHTLPENTVTVLRKPGVMDPVADSAKQAMQLLGKPALSVRTFRRFHFPERTPSDLIELISRKVFANEAIEQIAVGSLAEEHFSQGADYEFVKITVPIRGMTDEQLMTLSSKGQLYLNLAEMKAIAAHFESLRRNPTDVELETIAQTWSEHCSHKTLRGPYEFNGKRSSAGILKDTIMHATKSLGRDWCVSVFVDNA
ncbi:MAG: phosphoribosylformylglycinamidine synthase, partial [Planctomycetota bacterium]